uniref:Secreted protein n=1 Tax=Oryza punctata TaxID=4537 RepID=A0A0E0K5Q5_ORYPU
MGSILLLCVGSFYIGGGGHDLCPGRFYISPLFTDSLNVASATNHHRRACGPLLCAIGTMRT